MKKAGRTVLRFLGGLWLGIATAAAIYSVIYLYYTENFFDFVNLMLNPVNIIVNLIVFGPGFWLLYVGRDDRDT